MKFKRHSYLKHRYTFEGGIIFGVDYQGSITSWYVKWDNSQHKTQNFRLLAKAKQHVTQVALDPEEMVL